MQSYLARTNLVVCMLGAIVTLVSMALMACGMWSLFTPFTIWTLVPYVMFPVLIRFAPSDGFKVLTLVISSMAFALALFGYISVLFSSQNSSTTSLIFAAVPLYQLCGVLLLVVSSLLYKFVERVTLHAAELSSKN